MEKTIKPTSLWDRIKDALAALRGKPHHYMSLGVEVKRCSDCQQELVERILERLHQRCEKSEGQYGVFAPGLNLAIDIVSEEASKNERRKF